MFDSYRSNAFPDEESLEALNLRHHRKKRNDLSKTIFHIRSIFQLVVMSGPGIRCNP